MLLPHDCEIAALSDDQASLDPDYSWHSEHVAQIFVDHSKGFHRTFSNTLLDRLKRINALWNSGSCEMPSIA